METQCIHILILKMQLIVLAVLVAAVSAAEKYPKPAYPAYPEPHVNLIKLKKF